MSTVLDDRCGAKLKGHVCTLPPETKEPDSPEGDHTHRCFCKNQDWVSPHPYFKSKYSGSGNCWCGRSEGAKIHEQGRDDLPSEAN